MPLDQSGVNLMMPEMPLDQSAVNLTIACIGFRALSGILSRASNWLETALHHGVLKVAYSFFIKVSYS